MRLEGLERWLITFFYLFPKHRDRIASLDEAREALCIAPTSLICILATLAQYVVPTQASPELIRLHQPNARPGLTAQSWGDPLHHGPHPNTTFNSA